RVRQRQAEQRRFRLHRAIGKNSNYSTDGRQASIRPPIRPNRSADPISVALRAGRYAKPHEPATLASTTQPEKLREDAVPEARSHARSRDRERPRLCENGPASTILIFRH